MKVGVVQMQCTPGDVEANCSRIMGFIRQAAERGCQAVVLPEMADTGYDMTTVPELASPLDLEAEGAPVSRVARAAREHGLWVVCGLSDRQPEGICNATAVLDPEGTLVTTYRKTHLAAYPLFEEDRYIHPGDSLERTPIGGLQWGLMICYDLRFPEIARTLVLGGAEVLCLVSAWPFPRLSHWQTLLRARAIENQAYVIAANRVGTDAGITFCGSSAIIDPYGVTVASAAEDREELIVGDLNSSLVTEVRDYMPVLRHRRQDLY